MSFKLLEEAPTFVRQSAISSFPFIHSVWFSYFAIISFTLATSILKYQSLTRFDEYKVFYQRRIICFTNDFRQPELSECLLQHGSY